MKKIGVGIIGLGYIGKVHALNSLHVKNVDYVAVADVSKNAIKWAKSIGISNAYSNYDDLLQDSNINAVIIALPNHLHEKCGIDSAEAGKDIFMEKPLARTVKEAKSIEKSCNKMSVKLMMGYPMRFDDHFLNQKKEIDSGDLGDIEFTNATYISTGPFFHRSQDNNPLPVPAWWFDKDLTGGGVLIDIGCHIINLLRWYFGEISNISSNFGYRYNMDFEDHAICMAQFESGIAANLTLGWFSQSMNLKIEALGTVKHSIVETSESTFYSKVKTLGQMLIYGKSDYYKPHLKELEHFVECVITDFDPSISFKDGINDLEVISKAYKNIVPWT